MKKTINLNNNLFNRLSEENLISDKIINNYINWMRERNLATETIRLYSETIKKYRKLTFNTDNLWKLFRHNLAKYEPTTLHLEKHALTSYAKFKKLKNIEWERITGIIPKVQKKFFPTINEEELNLLKKVRFEETSARWNLSEK